MRLNARYRVTSVLIVLAALVGAPAPLLAQELPPEPPAEPAPETAVEPQTILDRETFMTAAPKGSLTVQIENDVFGGGTDRHYTNGLRISYVFPAHKLPPLARFLRRITPFIDRRAEMRVMGAVGQNIFTPSDILDPALIADDRPYAGWLYGEIGLSVLDGRVRDVVVLSATPAGYDFDVSALDAVRQWSFEPALFEGQPIDAVINFTVQIIADPPPPGDD